ncbi:hypothetical protein AB395_00003988 [Sinorhizobium fredii CCBAU 45436]|nr:hypothetical protein AB395_00003988 [Sinorhizobium fredii CCBAU 45436]
MDQTMQSDPQWEDQNGFTALLEICARRIERSSRRLNDL